MKIEVTIGKYYFCLINDRLWLFHESGEGMEIQQDELEQLIAKYYKENF